MDLDEIDASPVEVVAHKATAAGVGVLIEDTSLDVDGADVGVNVRWIVDHIADFAGRAATWRVLIAVLLNDAQRGQARVVAPHIASLISCSLPRSLPAPLPPPLSPLSSLSLSTTPRLRSLPGCCRRIPSHDGSPHIDAMVP